MSEAAPISSQSAPHRGRGGRRGRAGRGRYRGSRRSDSSSQEVQTTQPQPVMNGSEPVVVASQSEAGDVSPHRGGHPGRGRGDRGRQAGGRRGRAAAGQRSIVISHRGGRGPPAVPGPAARVGSSGSTALRAAAPEFVPGQPVLPSRSVRSPAILHSEAHRDRSSEPQAPAAVPKPQVPAPRIVPKSTAADLPTRIHEDIDNRQYECVICTNDVLRSSKVWSCSICWTVAHLHCVKKWHTNQVKERDENQRPNQPEGWRCPGCNSTLIEPPGPYRCWCGKDIDPKPIPGLPPHTCGQTCSKSRATCPHQCSLMCHAGPCPPCTLMGPTQTCFCGKKTSTKRCSETDYGKGWSCHEPCGDMLPCGEHYCSQPCHAGLCGACEIPVPSACYCGKDHREIPCNQRDDVLESFDYGQLQASESNAPKSRAEKWFEGSFRCGNVCNRTFDCGNHSCQKACHPQDELVAHCPFSPDVVTHCPCGKTPLSSMSAEPRKSCQDPVPRCDKPCNKVLACGHLCQDKCHTGSCAPCTQIIDITCRCGRTTGKSACHQGNVEHPLCFRVCRAQLNCGRHECGERCCSGEKKAAERRKQKRNANENYEPEHICLQVCGRQLKCGKHTCQQLCHKGPCMSCPEAIFDEISCSCGRTVLQPPQPCGTRPPECRFPCTRARPCGHPSVHHQCHSDETACPKCPFLVEKLCVCGKKTLKNQPCWFEEARCGLPCGKKLKCGAHECRKPCHKPGECEDVDISGSHCSQPCGKVRKSCDHTCADQCHAPYPCKEDKPCQSKTFRTCPCQHRKQEVRCQATKLNPWPNRESTLKCDDECLRLQRNRQLAEALNIDPETHSDDHIPYSDTTLKLFRENVNWAQTQEREFRVFAAAPDEKRLRFKPMQAHQRAFLHALAEDFGLDSESQDPEPHRHVCVFKTPRFVSAPRKTLAQCLRIAKAASNLGTGASGIRTTPLAAPGPRDSSQVFNALLLRNPRFGLTIDELDAALATDLAKATTPSGSLTFTTSFLPSAEEVLIKAAPNPTAAASAPPPTPQAVESALTALKPAVARTISRQRLAGAVLLCHVVVDDCRSMPITRREGDGLNGSLPGGRGSSSSSSSSGDGWSAVASRGSWRRTAASRALRAAAQAGEQERAPSAFVALRKGDAARRKKEGEGEEVVPEEMWGGEEEEEVGAGKKGGEQRVAVLAGAVAEDWLAAVEEEERLGSGNGSVSGVEGTVDVAAAAASAEDGVDDVKGDGSEVESKGETAQGKELESPETAAAAAAAAEGA